MRILTVGFFRVLHTWKQPNADLRSSTSATGLSLTVGR